MTAAEASYAVLAPHYDAFTSGYPHDRWLPRLAELAMRHGLRERRVLDVGCGTGKSLKPLVAMGFAGAGCDISSAMLERSAALLPEVQFFRADMRRIPAVGTYPWITCINDAVNHLLSPDDLEEALRSMSRALEPGGLITFDVNTLATHRWAFTSTFVVVDGRRTMCWRGHGAGQVDQIGIADLAIFTKQDRGWQRSHSRHVERWFSDEEIESAATAASLEIVARYGQRRGALVEGFFDPARHAKVVYFLRRPVGRRATSRLARIRRRGRRTTHR